MRTLQIQVGKKYALGSQRGQADAGVQTRCLWDLSSEKSPSGGLASSAPNMSSPHPQIHSRSFCSYAVIHHCPWVRLCTPPRADLGALPIPHAPPQYTIIIRLTRNIVTWSCSKQSLSVSSAFLQKVPPPQMLVVCVCLKSILSNYLHLKLPLPFNEINCSSIPDWNSCETLPCTAN